MEKPTSQVLEEAAELIEQGFNKGWYSNNEQTAFCTVGALNKVTDERFHSAVSVGGWHHPAIDALTSFLDLPSKEFIPDWNDKPERTQEEVIDVMITVAKQYRDKGL